MTEAEQRTVQDYLRDHAMLLAAFESPAFWSHLLEAELDGAELADVTVEPVGTGQVASCLRVRLAHGHDGGLRSVVVKTASADPVSRSTSAALRHPATEVGFYNRFAPQARVRTPQCHLATVNEAGDDFLLVLEDMDRATQGDQIEGMDLDAAARAVDELAALHATWWEDLPAHTTEVLGERGDHNAHSVLLGMLHPGFAERYGERLEPEVLELAETLLSRAPEYLGDRPGPSALVHGDFRPDNLLVAEDGVAVVDWQTVNSGPALADLSYFLGGALLPADRAAHENELLGRYRRGLGGHGVEIDMATIESGYRRYALDGLVMAIGASQVVGRTERGDDMFCTMAERSAAHAVDAGTLELI